MKNNNVLMSGGEFTVIANYEPEPTKSSGFQSEQDLENQLINQLIKQGFEYIKINSEEELIANLRQQIEKLNDFTFTDKDWKAFFHEVIANKNENNIISKTKKIQEEKVFNFELSDENNKLISKNIKIIDDNILNNKLQVINQYENNGDYKNIYDVTILVNGLPLVHIELKKRGRNNQEDSLREAFNQINRYQRDSFWADSGLFNYIQIFIISNGTYTKYYSNTLRQGQVDNKNTRRSKQQHFRFTNYWADNNNKQIPDLIDFTKTFLTRRTLMKMIVNYCVFNTSEELMIMRPYQIAATEKIMNKIKIAENNNLFGKENAGGYVFHTTGSGKTLTSFKTAKLLTEQNNSIDKVIFVVDRQDLDYQTMLEFNKFEKNSVSGSTSTVVLTKQIEDPNNKIIVTTIQKLANFIKKNELHPIYKKRIVFIFDECHRSQFGEMNKSINNNFQKNIMFGFTGTPIYEVNANKLYGQTQTTQDIFGDELHKYTIIDAIYDKNVLPFKVDYVNSMKINPEIKDEKIEDIDTRAALEAPERINNVVDYILNNYASKTYRNDSLGKFNSIFAVGSINLAIQYYNALKNKNHDLKVAMIYSYYTNEDIEQLSISEENTEDTGKLDKSSRDHLETAIKDYNEMFGTSFDTGSSFKNYYKDLSNRVKNREVDILIVVNMFLTGFDAKKVNTLWIDKNLKHHGLIQAFSRTNRIDNDLKTHGNIVNFRDLKSELNDALSIFSQEDNGVYEIALIRTFDEYYSEGYVDDKDVKHSSYFTIVENLMDNFPTKEITTELKSETMKKDFINLFNDFLKRRHILSSFEEFQGEDLITQDEIDIYRDTYLKLKDEFRQDYKSSKTTINEDIVFELELIRRDEVNVDYILHLIQNYVNTEDEEDKDNQKNKIDRTINANISLRSKRVLLETFIDKMNLNKKEANENISSNWENHIKEAIDKDIDLMIESFNGLLKEDKTRIFIKSAIIDNETRPLGISFDEIFKMSRRKIPGAPGRSEIKEKFLYEFKETFSKYLDI